jgi:hypothetical protein
LIPFLDAIALPPDPGLLQSREENKESANKKKLS